MNREKILFLVVLGLALLWGGSSFSSPYQPAAMPSPQTVADVVPPVAAQIAGTDGQRLLTLVAGVPSLRAAHPGTGRTVFVPHTDLLPVEPAVISLPRALGTPWVLPPIRPFPGVEFYRWFCQKQIPVVPGGATEEAPVDDGTAEPDPGISEEEVLTAKKKEFVASEWDKIVLPAGLEQYGRISLKDDQRRQGRTKYDLLLDENRTLPFYWERIDTQRLTVQGSGMMTLDTSRAERVEFSDTIENRYWSRRATARVKADNAPGLVELGLWIQDLAEMERYDRMTGLDLAIRTLLEAVAAAPGDLPATLALGEAYHRAFRFDEELALYEDALAAKPQSEIERRLARLYRVLAMDAKAEEALSRALARAAGDTQARLARAEVRYDLGRIDEAAADFAEAERLGSPEEKVAAREGRARTLLANGKPAEAAAALVSATDAKSLVTRGAAMYAQKRWADALEAFRKAAELAPGDALALTNLGFAQAWTATDSAGIDAAVATLAKARDADVMNYFFPPLGQGFAEQRRDMRTASLERYETALAALPTDPYAHYVLGRSYLRDGRFEDARRAFLSALSLDYRFADALFGAGTASLELGDWAAARAQLGRVVELEVRGLEEARSDPGRSADARDRLVRARYRLGRAWLLSEDVPGSTRWAKAEEQFAAILAVDDTWAPALNAIAYLRFQRGDTDEALNAFDRARSLAPKDEEAKADRDYPEECKRRILDSLGRRRWIDTFDRPDTSQMTNGWVDSKIDTLGWRLTGGKMQVAGRAPKAGEIWLIHNDPVPRSSNLGGRFIRARATANVRSGDLVEFRFLAFTRDRNGLPQSMISVGRNPRGQVLIVTQKASEKGPVETVLKDADGNDVAWPSGDVALGIDRIDHDKGIFAVSLNGERVGTVELGLKRGANNSDLWVGFVVKVLGGDAFEVSVDDVELEIYYP